jgi:hypothetical protein
VAREIKSRRRLSGAEQRSCCMPSPTLLQRSAAPRAPLPGVALARAAFEAAEGVESGREQDNCRWGRRTARGEGLEKEQREKKKE